MHDGRIGTVNEKSAPETNPGNLCRTAITTNLAYEEWPNFLGNPEMVHALLNRLRHYCHTIRIEGPELRDLQG